MEKDLARRAIDRCVWGMQSFHLHFWLWAFVAAAAICDITFALVHVETMPEWELNPFMTWVLVTWGVETVVCFRLFTVIFAFVVISLASPMWRSVATAVIVLAHLCLLVLLSMG